MTENKEKNEYQISSSELEDILAEYGLEIEINDIFVNDYGYILKLVGFDVSRYTKHDGTPDGTYYGVFMLWDRFKKEWVEPSYSKKRELEYLDKFIKIEGTPEEFIALSLASLTNPPEQEEVEIDDETTAITNPNSQDKLIIMRDQVQAIQDRTNAIMRVVENMMGNHKSLVNDLQKKIAGLQKIISLAETFLGIYQELHTLKEGIPANVKETLHIRQRVAFMDEEVGDVTRKGGVIGIDFRRVEDFDEWLLKDDHYKYLLPEEKGIVAIRPSRQEHHYHADWLLNIKIEKHNDMMYLMIRNGENLYRIWTEMKVGEKLFPSEKEYEEIMEAILNDGSTRSGKFGSRKYFSEDAAKDAEFSWRKNAVLIEGLFYHSHVLKPHLPEISLFKQASYENKEVLMIRDAEPSLHDGSMRFNAWKKEINSHIKKGSRVVLSGRYPRDLGYGDDFQKWRFGNIRRSYRFNLPISDVYEIIEAEERTTGYWDEKPKLMFKFRYDPRDEYRESDRLVGFWIRSGDEFVLNYDLINLEDINHFIASRIERESYQMVLPLLYKLRAELLIETEYENHFSELVAQDMKCDIDMVLEAVDWWKYKNIYKRPLKKDDDKAWRMIRKRIKRMKKEKKNVEPERA